MSASVTVSMAEDRIGMFSGMPRVRSVLVSAWLGRTEDSRGCSRTSSNVSPSGISGASSNWAISAHGRATAIRQEALRTRCRQNPLCRLEVHAFDHLAVEPLCAAAERLDERLRALQLGFARRES